MKWSGLLYNEGPDAPGDVGPYRQSERSELYKKYTQQLLDNGQAYYAFDTTEEIEQMRERSGNSQQKYDSTTRMTMKNSLTLPKDEVEKRIAAGDDYVIRLKVPANDTIRFKDIIREDVSFNTADLDDQVLLKSDGLPTYHLANVVDDHTMGITHVIRGEEWLSSAPKHILLYQNFGWEPPQMAHLPLIMSPAGGKLSKRNAEALGIPVNVRDYIKGKYEPDALINFLAFLGWSTGDDREMLSLADLIKEFNLEKVSKSGAVFNIDKLTWYNENYLRARTNEDLLPQVQADVVAAGFSGVADDFLLKVIELLKERVSLVSQFMPVGRYYFEAPSEYDEKSATKAWKEDTNALVEEYRVAINATNDFSAANLKTILSTMVEAKGIGFGKLMLPLRIAVTGVGFGPDLFETIAILGKNEIDSRLKKAISTFG